MVENDAHKKTPKLSGAFELFSKSYELVKKNQNTFAILYILPLVISLGRFAHYNKGYAGNASYFSSSIPAYAVLGIVGVGIFIAAIVFIIGTLIASMTYTLQLEAAKGRTPTLQGLYDKARKYWLRIFGLTVVVGLVVLAGLLALIVPGLIFIRRYFLAPYVMIDKDTGIVDAMKQSAEMTKPYSPEIWSIIGVMILLSFTSFIPVIGWLISFVLGVIYSVAPALRYQELKKLI